jgi:hypothetical protein
MEQQEELPSFRPGLSREIRARIRARIEERMVAKAREEARIARLTLRCRGAVQMERDSKATSDQVRAEHVRCHGELVGGGCLCICHDPNE